MTAPLAAGTRVWHNAVAWESDTFHELPGGNVLATTPDRCLLDETDTTAETCESCKRWTLDKRTQWNGGECVTLCGDCADGTYPARWAAHKAECYVPRKRSRKVKP